MLLCSHSIAGKFPYPPKIEKPMSEAKAQAGSSVKGSRELSYGEIGKMNQFKDISRQFIKLLREQMCDIPPGVDNWEAQEWIRQAEFDMKRACMAACRAVARQDADC
ncbi:hypothetical protein [Enterobacter asburiae]|uniref:Acb2/Tad1 domain-containing protein n=1 Tax=Enterobacter asburiae TaxID=61645 RepID=UPI0039B6EB88